MDKTITTALLIVISVVVTVMMFNAVYPAIQEGSDAIVSVANRNEARLRSEVAIIHAAGELDSDGWWQDTNGNGQFDVFVWVKNVGDSRITALDRADVFFGPEGNFARIPYVDYAGGNMPYWSWSVENDAEWTPTATGRITIHYTLPLTSGRYFVKMITSGGVEDDYILGM
jgi:archaellum component FlaG (FlaF/FlaG flagellin family)